MEATAQDQAVQAVPWGLEKPLSIKVLQWIHLILGLIILMAGIYLLFTLFSNLGISEAVSSPGIALPVTAIAFSICHLVIFYSLLVYQPVTVKSGFLVNLLLIVTAIGSLVYFWVNFGIRFTPTECGCSGADVIACDCIPFPSLEQVIAAFLIPLIIFNFLSLLVIWRSLRIAR